MTGPAVLTVRRHWPRPATEMLEAFAGAPTGHVVSALGGGGAIDFRLRPLWESPPFIGPALPVGTTARDVLATYAALKFARPGDVLMIATGGFTEAAVMGEIMAGTMLNAGVVAVVTDGVVRDLDGIASTRLPVYARGLSPNSPLKHGPGTVGLPISLGGLVVNAGDVVIGDRDGVVVVPLDRVQETIAELANVREREAALDARVKAGVTVPDWVAAALDGDGVRFVDQE